MTTLFPQPCPQLPGFQSLLVKGAYHASAPFHLALSHATLHPDDKIILLTPNRGLVKDSLVELNEEWLDQNSGHGRVNAAARQVEIYYPPTLAHLRLLLSMFHEYHDTLHDQKTTLDVAPSLLILHETSSYFDAPSSEAT
ncbi:hypothetical protein GY45DRAFT_1240491 [Cubamyces sp. BRFM 1775]|nr:hypothetical protein GY45DRAFT_1240491 [Cubamyces sp. BRFM 1775]